MSTGQPVTIPRNLLFRYRFRCPKLTGVIRQVEDLPATGELPVLGMFDGQTRYATIRCAWNDDGLTFGVAVRGKQQSIWTRANQPLDSDGLQLWIDTRDTHNVHRATRYCHWFYTLPVVSGGKAVAAQVGMLKINRAKEDSPTINRGKAIANATLVNGGYDLLVRIPSNLLNGWSPTEQRSLGFHFAVLDRELGWNTLGLGLDLPVQEDPSLWSSLTMVD